MDRVLFYPGEVPRSNDILAMNKNALYALSALAQAIIGNGPSIAGLPIAPTSPASLQVTIGAGSIYVQATVDATAYAGLGTDPNSAVKQGLLSSPATLTLTPPATTGYSQVFLVQVAYSDVDSGATVLPYYNSANPSVPYAGPNNSGASQFTQRNGVCVVALKAGIAAATGSQTIPSPDAGYTGVYAITLANGQTCTIHPDGDQLGKCDPQRTDCSVRWWHRADRLAALLRPGHLPHDLCDPVWCHRNLLRQRRRQHDVQRA
jgi:hypothetical protein